MKIKLNKSQLEKVISAENAVRATNEQLNNFNNHLRAIQLQKNNAEKHYKDILELIGDANGIDLSKMLNSPKGISISIDADNLIIVENEKEKSSDRITKQLKK